MEQSVEPNSLERFKVIASTAHTLPIFQMFLKKKISQKIQAGESGSNIL